ncbi:MAG TPA: ADOP family duplicated permease [Longimicrobiales bacterium]|nr:ADOP family duplicated permease [Longimicrobiales bacterium]
MVMGRLGRLLRGLLAGREQDRELDEELRFHLEMEAGRAERAGLDAGAARRRAQLAFGGVERFREAAMAERAGESVRVLARDVALGWRALRRAPGFTVAVVVTLGLGIGAATAAFTLIDGVLGRPLVYGGAERLYVARELGPRGGQRAPSYPAVRDWQERTRAFESISYVRGDEFNVRTPEGALRLVGGYATPEFFRTMATLPLLGRSFDEPAAEPNVVVLSHHVWQGSFGGASDVVGSTLATADGSYTVIGVMPPGFVAPWWADAWLPLAALPPANAYALAQRTLHVDAEVYVRTRPGVDAAAAKADLDRVVGQLADEYPEGAETWREASLTLERDRLLGNADGTPAMQRPAAQLRIMGAAVVLLLLIACVNVAGLQLARGTARRRELAVRSALGAGRGRLVAQLGAESLVLAGLGGTFGVLLAYVTLGVLARRFPLVLPRLAEVGIDARALLVALALTMLTALLAGLLPALRAASAALMTGLRERAGAARSTLRLRGGLVVAQIALASILVVGAGLLLRSLARVQELPLGFEPEERVALRVFPPTRYQQPEAAAALYRRLQEAVRQVPGVVDVALANHLPLAGAAMPTRVLTGRPDASDADAAFLRSVSPEFFRVMGVRVRRGRGFTDADVGAAGGALIVNQAFVRRLLADEEPIGRSVTIFRNAQGRSYFGAPLSAPIVGVVEDERYFDVQGEPPPMVFVPYTAVLWGNTYVVARTRGAPETLLPALRRAVAAIDADIPVAGPHPPAQWRPLSDFVAQRLESRRLQTGLLGGFGLAALLLALLGVFGVSAYGVALRTREIGVRIALGARPVGVLRLVLGHALGLAVLGTAAGLAAALAGSRLLESQLFGIPAHDPVTLLTVAVLFPAAAAAAALVPARHALRISPLRALRSE